MKKEKYILMAILLSLFLFPALAASAADKEAAPAAESLAAFPVEFKHILRDKEGVVARAEDEKGQVWAFLPSSEIPASLTGFSLQGRSLKRCISVGPKFWVI